MGFFGSKLEKLSIYKLSSDHKEKKGLPLKVMFNPESLSANLVNNYSPRKDLPTPGKKSADLDLDTTSKAHDTIFLGSQPETLTLSLVFDGTGVTEYGWTNRKLAKLGVDTSVTKHVEEFVELCYDQQEDTHVPNPLHILWGILDFKCVLLSNSVKFSVFNLAGEPLRAEMSVVFQALRGQGTTGDGPSEMSSPDLTHAYHVKAGDTLPVLVKRIYGTSKYYLQIARINKLTNFRRLTPGQTLLFPPLDQKNPV